MIVVTLKELLYVLAIIFLSIYFLVAIICDKWERRKEKLTKTDRNEQTHVDIDK